MRSFISIGAALASAAAVNGAALAPVVDAADAYGVANGAPYLNQIAQGKGKLWFGTAADIPGTGEYTNKEYMTILNNTKIFGQITPANAMKFEQTEPTEGNFDYSMGDVITHLAADRGKYVRCHNLIWQSELAPYVYAGNWTNATLTAVMKRHISNVVQHFGGRCYSWDVVNEALNGDGTYTDNIWYQHIGAAYVPLAFKFAAQAVKKTKADIKLYYNDYGIENPGTKQQAVVSLVKSLQAQNIQIDGIGLESHFEVQYTPSTSAQAAAMESYTSLGLEVAVTELDIRFTNVTAQANAAGFAQQAQGYYDTVAACMAVDGCRGVTVWDFDDEYSWIPGTFAGQGAACLYNEDFTRKPAFKACAQALQGVKCTVCG